VPDPEAFDHALVGFTMAGRHLELDCTECHANARLEVLPEGARRFLGLERDCASCHDDPHEGRMTLSCSDCHVQESFETIRAPGHDEFLPLVGAHGGLDCRECHAKAGEHALERMGDAAARPPVRACTSCHDSPHSVDFTVRAARLVAMPADLACRSCHEPEHTSFRDERLAMTPEQHAASGFRLDPPHDTASCRDCHTEGALRGTPRDPEGVAMLERFPFATRYPGRSGESCRRCHDDPHGGQFDEGPFAGQECTACHQRQHFTPHAFTEELHAKARLPLTGRHTELECEVCHERPAVDAPRLFRGIAARCEDCHEDAHRGFFARLDEAGRAAAHGEDPGVDVAADAADAADRAFVGSGTCARCHGTTRFRDIPDGAFDHGWTGFPLSGAHAQAACATCHPRSEEPDELGRTFGFVHEHYGRIEGCATCHEDPHRGAFDDPGLPAVVADRAGCARCHETTSFRVLHDDRFDHGRWTGFPLEGAHGRAACSQCHESTHDDATGRSIRFAPGTDCASCHEDPHRAQFEVGGIVDCSRCHRSADSFRRLSFNHNLDSRFPLDEAHASVSCAECHPKVLVGETEIVRYRPIGRRCVDCHGEPRQPLRRRRKGGR